MQAPAINLVPQEELHEQEKVRVVKASTIIAIVFLFIVILVSGYFFYNILQLNKQSAALEKDISNLRQKITALSGVEITARNLDKKYSALSQIFSERVYYSLLMEELKTRKPEEIQFESMEVRNGTVNIAGIADNYVSISGFINNLLNKLYIGGNPVLKSMFTSVSLNSVSLEGENGEVKFFIVVNFDSGILKL